MRGAQRRPVADEPEVAGGVEDAALAGYRVPHGARWSRTGSRLPVAPSPPAQPAPAHRRVRLWLLEDLVRWYVDTDRLPAFWPRRN